MNTMTFSGRSEDGQDDQPLRAWHRWDFPKTKQPRRHRRRGQA
ncbi:MAG TPA: hypothetical protein VFS21_01820 [Roseiflexaceae bacterium]|nr:hypothetical protein [Roseiflexaceae bacterium]